MARTVPTSQIYRRSHAAIKELVRLARWGRRAVVLYIVLYWDEGQLESRKRPLRIIESWEVESALFDFIIRIDEKSKVETRSGECRQELTTDS